MKKVKKILKFHIKAGQASPAPPLGPALAEQGININDFCQRFNEQTKEMKYTLPVVVKAYEGGSYDFQLRQPLTSELLKEVVGIEKGSGEPNKKKVAKITKDQLKEIAKRKMPDLNVQDVEQAIKIIEGTAKSMGIEIQS
jgi:large subunit ribosomal protein L11